MYLIYEYHTFIVHKRFCLQSNIPIDLWRERDHRTDRLHRNANHHGPCTWRWFRLQTVSTGISLSCNNLRNSATNAICEMSINVFCFLFIIYAKGGTGPIQYPSLVCSGSVTSMQWSGRSSDCPGLRVLLPQRSNSMIPEKYFKSFVCPLLERDESPGWSSD